MERRRRRGDDVAGVQKARSVVDGDRHQLSGHRADRPGCRDGASSGFDPGDVAFDHALGAPGVGTLHRATDLESKAPRALHRLQDEPAQARSGTMQTLSSEGGVHVMTPVGQKRQSLALHSMKHRPVCVCAVENTSGGRGPERLCNS